MDKRSYQKHPGELELANPDATLFTNVPVTPYVPVPSIPGYSKGEGTRSPALFIIISGGIKRERDYFTLISNASHFPRIKIPFVAELDSGEDGLEPRKMYLAARQVRQKYDASKADDIKDSMYLVVDVDDFEDQLCEIMPKCKKEGIQLVISNCCFEVWLYYGKFGHKPADFQVPENKSKISSSFKTYLGAQVKGGVNPRKAILDIEQAIANSKNNYEEKEDGFPALFSTQMHCLAEKILPFIREELEMMKEEERQRREFHKR